MDPWPSKASLVNGYHNVYVTFTFYYFKKWDRPLADSVIKRREDLEVSGSTLIYWDSVRQASAKEVQFNKQSGVVFALWHERRCRLVSLKKVDQGQDGDQEIFTNLHENDGWPINRKS